MVVNRDEVAVIHEGDPIRVNDGVESVGDGDDRAPGKGGIEVVFGRSGCDRVEIRGGFVEDDDVGIGGKYPCERELLLLGWRERLVAVADDRVEAFWKVQGPFFGAGSCERRLNLFGGQRRLRQSYVLDQ